MNDDAFPTDTDLVACAQDALPPRERAAVLAAAARADVRARLDLLAAVDAAVVDALAADVPAADPVPARRPAAVGWRHLLVAAAAIAVVALVTATRRRADAPAAVAGNAFVALRAAPHGGGEVPLFADVAFDLHWRGGDGDHDRWAGVRVLPAGFGDAPAALATTAAAAAKAGEAPWLPVTVRAELQAPDGTRTAARLRPDAAFDVPRRGERVQTVHAWDFDWQTTDVEPFLAGAPGDRAWRDDFLWPFQHMAEGQPQRWFPDQPGAWSVAFVVESLPPPTPGMWPEFAVPLRVTTGVVLSGLASAWSEPVDGMRARLLVATGVADPDHTPIAVQLRNESGRLRRYNTAGSTLAKIAQPLHWTLVVDGEAWDQRAGLDAIVPARSMLHEHRDGATRLLVGRAEYWRHGGTSLAARPGPHQLQVRFHFAATTWMPGDRELWQGDLLTPAVAFAVPGKR